MSVAAKKESQSEVVAVVATKCDLEQKKEIVREGVYLAEEFKAGFFQVKSATGKTVDEIFEYVYKQVLVRKRDKLRWKSGAEKFTPPSQKLTRRVDLLLLILKRNEKASKIGIKTPKPLLDIISFSSYSTCGISS